jgi:ABC-type molybdate transport system substrate-binding protein
MSLKMNVYSYGALVAGLVVMASPAWAVPDICTIVPSGGPSGYYDTKIAVASNFYQAEQYFVANFFTAPGAPGDGKYVNICQNATTALLTEIQTGSSGFSLFLAADAAAPDSLVGSPYVQSGAASTLYAKGVPVLTALTSTVPYTNTLVPSLPSSQVASTISTVVTSSQALSPTNAATVAVADPAQAPYGFKASQIIKDMGFTWSPPSSPTWVNNPLYANITVTLNAVATGSNKSGFVSKGQICPDIGVPSPTYIYVEFTNSKYTLHQKAIAIASGDAGQDALGASLLSYMLSDLTFWNAYLEESCYGQITGSRLFAHHGVFKHHKMPVKHKAAKAMKPAK